MTFRPISPSTFWITLPYWAAREKLLEAFDIVASVVRSITEHQQQRVVINIRFARKNPIFDRNSLAGFQFDLTRSRSIINVDEYAARLANQVLPSETVGVLSPARILRGRHKCKIAEQLRTAHIC